MYISHRFLLYFSLALKQGHAEELIGTNYNLGNGVHLSTYRYLHVQERSKLLTKVLLQAGLRCGAIRYREVPVVCVTYIKSINHRKRERSKAVDTAFWSLTLRELTNTRRFVLIGDFNYALALLRFETGND